MSSETKSPGVGGSEKALRWIAGLDHPFYDDERQRFVWYEASTIGFQLFLYVNLAILGTMAWIGGTGALPYVWPMLVAQFVVVIKATEHAARKHAECTPTLRDLASGKTNLYVGLLVYVISGLARGHWGLRDSLDPDRSGFFGGAIDGFTWGLVTLPFFMMAGLLVGAVLVKREALSQAVVDE